MFEKCQIGFKLCLKNARLGLSCVLVRQLNLRFILITNQKIFRQMTDTYCFKLVSFSEIFLILCKFV